MHRDVHAMGLLHSRESELVPLIRQLVATNSYTGNVEGVNAVGEMLKQALADTRLRLSTTQGKQVGDHLCFSTTAAEHAPAILLIGHHDTVFPPGSFEGFHLHAGEAHGPGVFDMKGGLAIVIAVLRALSEADVLDGLPLRFISVSDEEIGSPTSRAWITHLAKGARAALVFEGGRAGDRIITRRRGSGNAVVIAHGKAAHAGNAFDEGRNAIWALAKYVDRVQNLHGSIAGATASVGRIVGGTARNVVPDEARCEVDLRFSDASGQHALIAALQEAAIAASHEVEGTRLEVKVEVSREPLVPNEGSLALFERYSACQEQSGLGTGDAGLVGGGSDANTVGALGIPTLDGLGPRGSGFHTRHERIDIASLMPKAEALLRFLLSERGDREPAG